MSRSILGTDRASFVKKIKNKKSSCIAVLCVAVALNILLTFFRNDRNHTWMLWLNILLDVAAGWFLIFYISLWIAPQQRLLSLYDGKRSIFEGTVIKITEGTQRVRHTDCFTVTFVIDEAERQFFLPANAALSITEGEQVQISAVSNIIVEIL